MTSSLAGLFSRLFPAVVLGCALIVTAGAGIYYAQTGAALTALVLVFGGLVLLVTLFGLVALQIENNALLRRIAEGTRPAILPETVSRPAQRPAADLARPGRAEPVVTIRPARPVPGL